MKATIFSIIFLFTSSFSQVSLQYSNEALISNASERIKNNQRHVYKVELKDESFNSQTRKKLNIPNHLKDSLNYDGTVKFSQNDTLDMIEYLIKGVPDVEKEYLVEQAKNKARHHFGGLFPELGYLTHDEHYLNGKLYEVSVRYYRKHGDGIVRKNSSYVTLDMDFRGKIKSIKYRWPKFVQEKQPQAKSVGDIYEEFNSYANNISIETYNQQPITATSIFADKVFPSWVEHEGSLYPTVTFYSDIEFENGKTDKHHWDILAVIK